MLIKDPPHLQPCYQAVVVFLSQLSTLPLVLPPLQGKNIMLVSYSIISCRRRGHKYHRPGGWLLNSLEHDFDGLMQKRRNSIANALELRLFCIKPLICFLAVTQYWCVSALTHQYVMLIWVNMTHSTLNSRQRDGCWWPGAHLAPEHLQLSLWCRPLVRGTKVHHVSWCIMVHQSRYKLWNRTLIKDSLLSPYNILYSKNLDTYCSVIPIWWYIYHEKL